MLIVAGSLFLMSRTDPNSTWTVLLPGFILGGLGIGIVNPVLASGAVSVVQPQRSGMASGANNTFRQVGIATGIAVLGAVFQSQIVSHTSAALTRTPVGAQLLRQHGAQLQGALPAGEVRQLASTIPDPSARAALLHAYHIGFSISLNHLMEIGAVVALVGALASFALVRRARLHHPDRTGQPCGRRTRGTWHTGWCGRRGQGGGHARRRRPAGRPCLIRSSSRAGSSVSSR